MSAILQKETENPFDKIGGRRTLSDEDRREAERITSLVIANPGSAAFNLVWSKRRIEQLENLVATYKTHNE